MFDRLASAPLAPRRALRVVSDAAEAIDRSVMQSEVATLFSADLEDFTRLAMDRRARKAARALPIAA